MLYALATPGSAFKPSINKPGITWRLKKFKNHQVSSRSSSSALSYRSENTSYVF